MFIRQLITLRKCEMDKIINRKIFAIRFIALTYNVIVFLHSFFVIYPVLYQNEHPDFQMRAKYFGTLLTSLNLVSDLIFLLRLVILLRTTKYTEYLQFIV